MIIHYLDAVISIWFCHILDHVKTLWNFGFSYIWRVFLQTLLRSLQQCSQGDESLANRHLAIRVLCDVIGACDRSAESTVVAALNEVCLIGFCSCWTLVVVTQFP
jgi:hypothetical protein